MIRLNVSLTEAVDGTTDADAEDAPVSSSR